MDEGGRVLEDVCVLERDEEDCFNLGEGFDETFFQCAIEITEE